MLRIVTESTLNFSGKTQKTKMETQKQVWNNIAKEWNKFRTDMPARHTQEFLKKQKGKIPLTNIKVSSLRMVLNE